MALIQFHGKRKLKIINLPKDNIQILILNIINEIYLYPPNKFTDFFEKVLNKRKTNTLEEKFPSNFERTDKKTPH